MEEAGGVGDPLIGDGNLEVSTVPTILWWPFPADKVDVHMWNRARNQWECIPLAKNEQQRHSVELPLKPSTYWFFFCVDEVYQHNPYISWDSKESEGFKMNYVCVKEHQPDKADINYDSCEGCPITYKSYHDVYVSGSWDNWKEWHHMTASKEDHIKLVWLPPGQHYMIFQVDGVVHIDQGTEYLPDANGQPQAIILNVMADPHIHELHGNTSAALLDDFMARSENEVSIIVKFLAGSRCGSIPPETKACPCTDVGYMLLNGFIREFKEEYTRGRGYSWAGCFKPTDMVVVDGKHCQMRRRATKLLTRANFMLDAYQLKACLLMKYMKHGLLPPYFTSLFEFLESPPEDFDSNMTSRARFLGFFDNQAALASPPRRMLSLVNMGQFFKQLPEEKKPEFAMKFMSILEKAYDWQKTTSKDKFLWDVFVAKRRLDKDGKLLNPPLNSSLEATYSLRVFFIHGPEHSKKNEVQILTDFAEFDLIIAHYFKELLAEFLFYVHQNVGEHPIIQAMWNFFCGGAPPDHLRLELWSPPAAPPTALTA